MENEKSIILSDEEKESIRIMFFGPYKPEWKINGIVDNRDGIIGKRLGIHKVKVSGYIDIILREHIRMAMKINKFKDQMDEKKR